MPREAAASRTPALLASHSATARARRPSVSRNRAFVWASETATIDLLAGRDYRLVGKCDADCSDLDFQLYDSGGTLLDSDLLSDDVPVISVSPARSGTYRLRVTMASCSVALCGWGVTVLAR